MLSGHCRQIGFDYCVYTPLLASGKSEKIFRDDGFARESDALIAQNILACCPEAWLQRYQEAGHAENDPVVQHVSRNMMPIFWSDAHRAQPDNIVMNEARDHGLVDGVTVSIYGHNGQHALLSVSNSGAIEDAAARKNMIAGFVQLTSNYVYEALRRLDDSQTQAAPALSVREKDCLQWSAVGKTSWEIGQILKISERTVVFHLTNAAKKLNASNRRQAVVRALSLRLIHP